MIRRVIAIILLIAGALLIYRGITTHNDFQGIAQNDYFTMITVCATPQYPSSVMTCQSNQQYKIDNETAQGHQALQTQGGLGVVLILIGAVLIFLNRIPFIGALRTKRSSPMTTPPPNQP